MLSSVSAPLSDQVEAENLLMDFAIWLALSRPSGRQIAARTIRKYVSQVRSWHLREFAPALLDGPPLALPESSNVTAPTAPIRRRATAHIT